MRDRQTWKDLNKWLATKNYGPYNAQNFSDFRISKNHYKGWLAEQARLDSRRARAESLRREIAADGFDMVDRTMIDLVDKLSDPELNPVKAAAAVAAIKNAVNSAARTEIDRRRCQIAEESAELDRERFRYQVAQDALTLFDDARARQIAEGDGDKPAKIAALLALMEEMEKG